MTAPRTDPHDGWTPQPQEQVQPGDPWRDPDDGDPEYQDAAYSAGRPEERMPTAPRTDPQSTVPVEPRDLPERVVVGANGAYWRDYGDHYSMCPVSTDNDPVEIVAIYNRSEADATAWDRGFKAGLDAARASQPVTATADSGEPIELAELLREFRLRSSLEYNKSEASRLAWATAYDLLAALPVREDEPTGIDGWTRLAEAWANVMDGRRIGAGLGAYRIGRHTTTTDDWHAIHDEYNRLTREASHVR